MERAKAARQNPQNADWGARPPPVAVFGVPAEYIFPSPHSPAKAVFEAFIRDNLVKFVSSPLFSGRIHSDSVGLGNSDGPEFHAKTPGREGPDKNIPAPGF